MPEVLVVHKTDEEDPYILLVRMAAEYSTEWREFLPKMDSTGEDYAVEPDTLILNVCSSDLK